MKACAEAWVAAVWSKKEILGTLDNGRLDELAFMPQMFQYCGQRFAAACRTIFAAAGAERV
jgi:hypothetical protein